MTTVEDFNLPDSCANCSSLRESIERYYEVTDNLNDDAAAKTAVAIVNHG